MGMIKEETIRRLIRLVEESQVDELEVSRWGTRVRITRRTARENSHGDPPPVAAAIAAGNSAAPAVAPPPEPAPAADPEAHLSAVKSPMVGTYYASPAPGEPPFLSVNDRVAVGQVVCIIEAMKLMNEIHSEVEGRVVKVLVGNGQPVEYGQTLFLIDPRG